jgi:S-(hydroxymethyl)glutathione dehydrogenase/alcohol dehydrogenase
VSEPRSTTRAAVLERNREPLRVEELELDPPGPGEVLVRITASGVCHSDLHQADGDWGTSGDLVLGHEGAGVVEAVGPGVSTPGVGETVALSWLYPCTECRACLRGRPWLCRESGALDHRMPDGTTRLHRGDATEVFPYLSIGTFAEREVVPARAAIPVPEEVAPEVAALIGCCVTTGVMAVLRAAEVRPGESAAVVGLGGVGMSVLMGAVLAGADPIVAIDRVPEKLERARELGATFCVRAGDDSAETVAEVAALTGGGPDHAFEAAGSAVTAELTVSLIPPGGTATLVGLPEAGARASFDANEVVDGSRRILGANYGWSIPAVDFPALAQHHLAGRLPVDRLVDARIGLEDVNDAFDALRRGEGLRRVVVFEP